MPAYHDLRPLLRTGDLVLFSGVGRVSRWIQLLTRSPWSHVGLIIQLAAIDMVLLWESTTLADVPDLDAGRPVRGVQLVGLRERLATYRGRVAVRRLAPPLTLGQRRKLGRFRSLVTGRPYEQRRVALFKSAWDGPLGDNRDDLSSLFCSELVAAAYQAIGLLPTEADGGLPASEYTPADFAQDAPRPLQLLNGAGLGPEIDIEREPSNPLPRGRGAGKGARPTPTPRPRSRRTSAARLSRRPS